MCITFQSLKLKYAVTHLYTFKYSHNFSLISQTDHYAKYKALRRDNKQGFNRL